MIIAALPRLHTVPLGYTHTVLTRCRPQGPHQRPWAGLITLFFPNFLVFRVQDVLQLSVYVIYRPIMPVAALSYLNTVLLVPTHILLTHISPPGPYHNTSAIMATLVCTHIRGPCCAWTCVPVLYRPTSTMLIVALLCLHAIPLHVHTHTVLTVWATRRPLNVYLPLSSPSLNVLLTCQVEQVNIDFISATGKIDQFYM